MMQGTIAREILIHKLKKNSVCGFIGGCQSYLDFFFKSSEKSFKRSDWLKFSELLKKFELLKNNSSIKNHTEIFFLKVRRFFLDKKTVI